MTKTLTTVLSGHITKPLGSFCEEHTLKETLRRRLTKKEYKILMQEILDTPTLPELMSKLSMDQTRYQTSRKNMIRKLNHDPIKRELFCV